MLSPLLQKIMCDHLGDFFSDAFEQRWARKSAEIIKPKKIKLTSVKILLWLFFARELKEGVDGDTYVKGSILCAVATLRGKWDNLEVFHAEWGCPLRQELHKIVFVPIKVFKVCQKSKSKEQKTLPLLHVMVLFVWLGEGHSHSGD